MSNVTRKPTVRGNLHRQNTTNGLTLVPPPSPFLPVSIASNSTNNIERGSMSTSHEQEKKQKKKIEDLGDQVVPQAKCGTKRPVIEHNGLDDYYRSRVDAPIFRYSSSNNNNNKNSNHHEDRRTSQTNLNGHQNNPIVVE